MNNKIKKSNLSLIYLLHFGFFLTGISTVLIGQVLPVLFNKLAINDSQAGQIFVSQFSGAFIGMFIFSYSLKKFGFIKTIFFGLVIKSLACLLINGNSIELCFLGFFTNGIGIGMTLSSINMLIAEFNPTRQTSALNFLNFFWGVGAIVSQPFVAVLGTQTSILKPTIIISSLLFITALLILLKGSNRKKERKDSGKKEFSHAPIWRSPIAWLIAIFNFFLIGIESGLGGWLTTYSARFPNAENYLISATPVFFLFFVIGRGIAPFIAKFLSDNTYIYISIVTLLSGVSFMLLANSYSLLILSAVVLGIGTSAVFPTNMARFTKHFGKGATRNATPIFVLGTLGGAATTWCIGFVSKYFNNLRSGIFVILISCLMLIFIQTILIFNLRKTKNKSTYEHQDI